ncbi:MAG: BREX system P-loop protein BrxC [Candidatus Poribacteria bacterium]|nr:BREX system P-loop protein BrxC [Candidatus Poribacteria bacterium]
MKISDLFARRIDRNINGVVKADQLDAASVWQELEEFVVTRELTRHMGDLVEVLLSTVESDANAEGRNGVWISGFFGCGKSHFIKVLSYLLENNQHLLNGQERKAIDFFADKFSDAMLFADLKKAVGIPTDTVLFNIDSKADHSSGRDALLQVFLKVLNEKQGYSSDYPHLAHMERFLDQKGKLEDFHQAFLRESSLSWLEERDAWEFHRDQVVTALNEVIGQSETSLEKWVDGGAEHFSLTVENLAHWVKQYLDQQGKGHRIMFLVDEVGQFIGNDTHLMLNLQTITEQLGTVCQGRAWVVVTSQEDLDAVLGDLKSSKQQDFSKIQGRFKTRLSLSSANVDEVIKRRLLDKKPIATNPLELAYSGKHDILKNQLSFVNAGMTFKTYQDQQDFTTCYPFAAYQFVLVQKVFESIRKAGATGLHLSQGERSILDAFQSAANQLSAMQIGALVPFHRFYNSVEGFLDTAVKRTIEQASQNHALQPFDSTLLRVLFLIRYVDELPGNVDNLVTLCIEEIDTDKLALRQVIEDSLARLENETLIARNGDLYFFLTNEERDIGREIKNAVVPSGSEEQELGKILFEDILGDQRKHTYSLTNRDFSFNRLCDDYPVGQQSEGNLEVAFFSPLGDSYSDYTDDARCMMHTSLEQGRVLIRLPDDNSLGHELRTYLQTEIYVKTKNTGALPDTTKRILRDRSEENRTRRSRILHHLRTLLSSADYFASGNKVEVDSSDLQQALGQALESLIKNAYPKMGFIHTLHLNPKQEIQSILRANDLEQVSLELDTPESNPEALNDLRQHVQLSVQSNQPIVLHQLIDKRYGGRPYGWPELELVLLVARLAVLKEINLLDSNTKAPIALDNAYDHLTSSSKQRRVILTQHQSAGPDLIKKAIALAKELFAQTGPNAEDALFDLLQKKLSNWNNDLLGYAPLADTGQYPGKAEIDSGLTILSQYVAETESRTFLECFVEDKADLLDLAEYIQDLQDFYTNQKQSWEQLREAVDKLSPNRLQLEADPQGGPALARMEEICSASRPYNLLREIADLTYTARTANDQLVSGVRGPAVAGIQRHLDGITAELDRVSADGELRNMATAELNKLLGTANQATSIAHIAQAQQTAEVAFDRALSAIEKAQIPPPPEPDALKPSIVKKRRVVEAKKLCPGIFIETPQDVEIFLTKLREVLEAAIDADERVQLK